MASFGLFKPFGIDHGQLDGLSAQQCFVLGYELGEIETLLHSLVDKGIMRFVARYTRDPRAHYALVPREEKPTEKPKKRRGESAP